jgi:hypothetical protein
MGEVDAPPVTVFVGGPYTSGFGSPADHEPFNQGRTVPIKFQLMDSSGAFITNLAPTLWIQQLGVGDVPVGDSIPATPRREAREHHPVQCTTAISTSST